MLEDLNRFVSDKSFSHEGVSETFPDQTEGDSLVRSDI